MTRKKKEQLNGWKARPEKPERDNEVDNLIDVLGDISDADIYHNSFVSRSTIRRLRSGKTKAPQFLTVQTMASAAGFEYVLKKRRPVR